MAKEASQKEMELLLRGRRFSPSSSSSPSFSKLGRLGFCLEEGKGFRNRYSTQPQFDFSHLCFFVRPNLHKTLHFRK